MGRLSVFLPFLPLVGDVTRGNVQPSPGGDFELVCSNPGWGSLGTFLRDAACSLAAQSSLDDEWVRNR